MCGPCPQVNTHRVKTLRHLLAVAAGRLPVEHRFAKGLVGGADGQPAIRYERSFLKNSVEQKPLRCNDCLSTCAPACCSSVFHSETNPLVWHEHKPAI
jgi:hypothetical protein